MKTKNKQARIYLRVSTKDKGQDEKLQLKDCKLFAEEKGLDIIEVVSEKASAFKNKHKMWKELIERCKQDKADIILWRYDRAFRNRKDFYEFMRVMFEVHNIKVYSVKEPSILSLWEMMSKQQIEDPIQAELIKGILKVLWKFVIQQAGEEAEEESRKKGERVKLSLVKFDKKGNRIKTRSSKGKLWGRKPMSKRITREVLAKRKEGLSIREIADSIITYDQNRNEKYISKSLVHKILKQNNKGMS